METRFISLFYMSPNNYVCATITPHNTVGVWIFSPPKDTRFCFCFVFFALINAMSESESHFHPFSHVGALTGVWEPGGCRGWCIPLPPECLCTSPARWTAATHTPTTRAHTPPVRPTRTPLTPTLTPAWWLWVCGKKKKKHTGDGERRQVGGETGVWNHN